jgi:hypothetical protein
MIETRSTLTRGQPSGMIVLSHGGSKVEWAKARVIPRQAINGTVSGNSAVQKTFRAPSAQESSIDNPATAFHRLDSNI